MAFNESNAPGQGILGAIKGALGIFSNLNKAENTEKDNFNPTPTDIYESEYPDSEIMALVRVWKARYDKYYQDIDASCKLSFEYWIGKQKCDENDSMNGTAPMIDNQIFPAVETFIPIATRSNPDPIVRCDPTDEGQKLAASIKNVLVDEADKQVLKKKLKRLIRHWLIYKIGVIKSSYNVNLERIETEVINPKRMIFDVDGHIDERGKFTGAYVGERKQAMAHTLMELFPKKADIIKLNSGEKMGTKIEYIEWWYKGRDVFYTMDGIVLGKFKNPHWNFDITTPADPAMGEMAQPNIEKGKNFQDEPVDPYTFLGIFSTGLQPHDETSLITQNIAPQDMVNRRWRQIDKNVDTMNNGMAVSNAFTADQASQAANALRRGTAIRVPSGKVGDAIMRLPAPGIPADVFNNLKDARQELQNIFGTSGSTPQGVGQEKLARGKIMANQLDASRIGGGITEYLEQVADTVYNTWIQFMFVHYTEPHSYNSGSSDTQELINIKNTDFLLTKTLIVTVKDGSLIPKDPLTQRNEAIDLWSANAIDPLTLAKKLDMPDPAQYVNQLILWQMLQKGQIQPQQYLSTFQVAGAPQVPGMAPQGQPSPDGGVPTAPGVGGQAVNGVGPVEAKPTAPPATADAVASQSRDLMGAIKV